MNQKLAHILSSGEGQTIEFKQSLSLRREGFEALCAMVNSDIAQGNVLFGIDPRGNIVGVEAGNLDKAQRTLSQAISNSFDPPLSPEILVESIEGKNVIILSAFRARTIPYHEYDGRAWIRIGSTNRQLTLSEKENLRTTRCREHHPGPWKCDRCGALVGQLVSFKVTNEGMKKTYDCNCGGEFWPV